MPASRNVLAVPPVERISAPSATRPRARSTTPVLFETLTNARFRPAILPPALLGRRWLKTRGQNNRCVPEVQGGAGAGCGLFYLVVHHEPSGRPDRPRDSFPSFRDRKSTRLNSSHITISYAVFCLKKKNKTQIPPHLRAELRQQVTLSLSRHHDVHYDQDRADRIAYFAVDHRAEDILAAAGFYYVD